MNTYMEALETSSAMGYQHYCDMVGTCGIYVEGNAEIAATADFISRHLLILGANADHDVYEFAGAIGLGAPAHLGSDEDPIIIAHWRTSQHFTGTRNIISSQWCAPKGAKRARIHQLQQEHENNMHSMEAARAPMIMQARSVAERARMSSMQLEEVSQEGLILPVTPTSAPPAVAPPSAAAPTAFGTCTLDATISPIVFTLLGYYIRPRYLLLSPRQLRSHLRPRYLLLSPRQLCSHLRPRHLLLSS